MSQAPPLAITDLFRDVIVNEIAPCLDPASLRYFASSCKELHAYFEDFALPTAKDILSEGHLRFAEVVLTSRACSLPNSLPPGDWGARVWWYVKNPFHNSLQSVFKYESLIPADAFMTFEQLSFHVLCSLVETTRDDWVHEFINSQRLTTYTEGMMDRLFFIILQRDDYIDVFRRYGVLPQVTAMITDAYEVRRFIRHVNKENVFRLLDLVAANEAFADSFREMATHTNYGAFWQRVFYVKACKIVGITPDSSPKSYSNNDTVYAAIVARHREQALEYLPWLEEDIVDKRKIMKSFATMQKNYSHHPFDTVFVEMWKAFDEKGWIDEKRIKLKDLVNMLIRRPRADLFFLLEWANVRHPQMARFIGAFLEFD